MRKKPRGKLFALLAIFAAIGLVTASGAFTSVQAERTMSVAVVGDASADLQLTDAGNGYVTNTGGEISIDFSNVNLRADTDFGAVLNITNNGPNDVNVQIATDKGNTTYTSDDLFENNNSINPQFTDGSGNNIEGGDDSTGGSQLFIPTGTGADVNVTISVSGSTTDTFNGLIVIHASTNDLTS